MNATAPVIALDTPAALDAARVGRKAAALAAARAAGLPVAPGVVLTADWSSRDDATALQVWRIISHDGVRPLVVRPSPTGRDRRPAAGAGAVEAATVVHDGCGLLAALAALRAEDQSTPVLVQPHVPATWRGTLFADDVNGGWRARPLVVAAPHDGPEWTAELDHAGRVREVVSAHAAGPPAQLLARLARLADKVATAFDGPHDLDWVAADDGRLQLLRVRPVVRLHITATTGTTAAEPSTDRTLVGTAA
jgi:rifampicin phosphotransferase